MMLVPGSADRAQRYSPRPLTDGERWTAEALGDLRRRGYRPGAWLAFVRASLDRSRAARRERPEMVRQARTWGAAGAAAWTIACLAARGRDDVRPRAAAGLVWWLAVSQMLGWHLGMAEGGDGRGRRRLSAADAVTLGRFWLVPVVPAVARSPVGLPLVVVIAGVTDGLDGALARRRGRTRLGRDLDTTADLAFISTVAISARRNGRLDPLPFWALAARHGLGLALSLGAVFGRARRPAIRARPWGALLRVSGLAVHTAGRTDAGTAMIVVGCLVPPRSTAAHLSPV
jgi:phosphatidylglycerophosphate synthase